MDFRLAEPAYLPQIMRIVADAQKFLRDNGVDQWVNGYPDEGMFLADMQKQGCYVAVEDGKIAGVATLSFEPEEKYPGIEEGKWLTNDDALYAVVHRSAVSVDFRGRGVFRQLMSFFEELSAKRGAVSVRVDTHRDNAVMRSALLKLGYKYCGRLEIVCKPGCGSMWVAYEKLL